MIKLLGDTYAELKENLKNFKCVDCEGSGKQNDADLGDIYYREWICGTCKGTGIKTK